MIMQTKDEYIQAIKREVGWAYPQLNWLTPEEAARAMEGRDQLLKELAGRVNNSYLQNKLHQGTLSPGCMTCGDGTWSCMFINSLCTANCFFCPQDRGMKEERPPVADESIFRSPKDYADYVQKVGFKGVSFSGGESLIEYDALISFIRELREKLGNGVYLWIYTNGDLVDRAKLKGLKQAGLDEIRFNIAARSYTLHSVELALNFFDTVTIEIPAIPEDFEIVKAAISTMDSMGVKHLNLHQLLTNSHNYGALASRCYTFLHHPGLPILESEMTALGLLLYAVEKGISLPINYCSQSYKVRLQGRGHRMRAAPFVLKGFEDITDSGYIRRITIQGTLATLKRLEDVLKAAGCSDNLWLFNEDQLGLAIHHSLLKYIDADDCHFMLSYFTPYLRDANRASPLQHTKTNGSLVTTSYYQTSVCDDANSEETVQELVLNAGRTFFAARALMAEQRGLSMVTIRSFQKLFIDRMDQREVLTWFAEYYDITTKEKIQDMAREKGILMNLWMWEQVPADFPDFY